MWWMQQISWMSTQAHVIVWIYNDDKTVSQHTVMIEAICDAKVGI